MYKKTFVTIALCLFATLQLMAMRHTETIYGLNYFIDTDAKEATLLAGDYSGDIKIPSSVTASDWTVCTVVALVEGCFKDSKITSVEIPSTVDKLPMNCFNGCTSLASVEIPSSVSTLGEDCFYNCSSLTSIEIPSSVTELGYACFYRCSSLTSIEIPSSVTTLGGSCFSYCSSLTSIEIPSSVTTLGGSCFSYCSSLTSIEIPSSVTTLGGFCFDNCSSLTNIEIPSSVTTLGGFCFDNCSSLTNIEIPSSVTEIGEYCFYNCSSLTSIEIPSSVTELRDFCFYNCSSLTEIRCYAEKVPGAFYRTFSGLSTSTCALYVPKKSLEAYKQDEHWGKFKYIYALDDNGGGTETKKCEKPEISYANGKLYFKSSTSSAKYQYTISDEDIKTDALDEDGEVELVATYNISAYATADGYLPSDKTTATLMWLEANTDNPSTNINTTAKRGIVAQSEGGIITISGLDEGEKVEFMSVDGKVLGSATSVGGTASFSTSEQIVIMKIGSQSVKLTVK